MFLQHISGIQTGPESGMQTDFRSGIHWHPHDCQGETDSNQQ
jgi:hypothetical protein